jgi:hypothetical protein
VLRIAANKIHNVAEPFRVRLNVSPSAVVDETASEPEATRANFTVSNSEGPNPRRTLIDEKSQQGPLPALQRAWSRRMSLSD